VQNSQAPWIEIKRSSQVIKSRQESPKIEQNHSWQAMFACQIAIRSYKERLNFKWGFNPAVLLEEALDRQKLFLETQLNINPIDNPGEDRTLTFRCICIPNQGLLIGLVAKVLAASQEKAGASALNYLRELESVFPYDYKMRPAASMEEFNRLTGREIFKNCNDPAAIAQIRRFESPLQTSKGILRMVGIWQTGKRSDEQIWRSLGHCSQGVLLNISIRPTTLFEDERQALIEIQRSMQKNQGSISNEPYLQNYESWIDPFINRHISAWNKYFFLQVFLVSPGEISDGLIRSIGSAITRDSLELATPGYQIVRPRDKNEAVEWSNHLDCLELIPTNQSLFLPRLSDMATLEETHAVIRLPYPLETGLPGAVFLDE
jgi:hypothetical protein